MKKCYFCEGELVWQNDWDYDIIYGEGEGVVSCWVCSCCGADHQFSLREDEE